MSSESIEGGDDMSDEVEESSVSIDKTRQGQESVTIIPANVQDVDIPLLI